jgi:diguanylate cyclase (GGDEF)-like protein
MGKDFTGKVVVYSRHIEDLKEILVELNNEKIDVTLESCEKCIVDLESCILDTLSETRADLVLIDNDSTNNGILLYKMIKDEGTLENIPVLFVGDSSSDEDKLQALKIGALDYVLRPLNKEEIILKVKNYIAIGSKYVNGSIYDNMTGIYVRSYGEEIARKEFELAKKCNKNFSVLSLDVDNMVKVNNALGKEAGDKIIREIIAIVRDYLEGGDFIYRASGQRFILVFTGREVASVYKISEHITKAISKLSEDYSIKISVTGGLISQTREEKDFKELLKKSYKVLEAGKLEEKGKVYLNEESLLKKQEKTILILEDDKVISSILSTRYINKGYKVFTAEEVEEAQGVIEKEEIDLVITDYIVPGITGVELIKALKSIKNALKVIILSSQKNERTVESALKAGADDYLVKPFSPIELDSRLSRLIN